MKLLRDPIYNEHLGKRFDSNCGLDTYFNEILINATNLALITTGTTVLGWADIYPDCYKANEAEIAYIVHPLMCRQGIGTYLVKSSLEQLQLSNTYLNCNAYVSFNDPLSARLMNKVITLCSGKYYSKPQEHQWIYTIPLAKPIQEVPQESFSQAA